MVTIPTTLVIGAGASAHLDYPSGEMLRTQILQLADGINPELRTELGFTEKDCKEFYAKFLSAGQPSIDRFLARHPQMAALGKTLIALSLIHHERHSHLFRHVESPQNHRNWYEDLFRAMEPLPRTRFSDNNLCILTFNYDRSLEHYLATALVSSNFEETYEDALLQLEALGFVHIHGQLGGLRQNNQYRPYNYETSATIVKNAAQTIQVVHEGSDERQIKVSPHLRLARERLFASERVLFLGFGYDEMNLAKLSWPKTRPEAGVIEGTWKGIARSRADHISQSFQIKMPDYGNATISDFLRSVRPLDARPIG